MTTQRPCDKDPHDFTPLSSVYQPVGWLYRTMANDLCAICGRPKAEHDCGV